MNEHTGASQSRHILVKFLQFRGRQAVMRAAREKGSVDWEGQRTNFCPDLCRDTLGKRRKYDEVKHQL